MDYRPATLVPQRTRTSRKLGVLIATVVSLGLFGLFLTTWEATAATQTVHQKNTQFDPADLTVNVGDTVTWTNDETDGTTHSAVSDENLFNSPDMPPGSTFSYTFTQPGTFGVHCRFHPSMTGTITVKGDGGSAPPSSASPTSATGQPTSSATVVPPPGGGDANGNGADLGDGTRLATYTVEGGVKVFRLKESVVPWEVSPGVIKQAYAFNGIVPGPVIRVNQFDRVRIIVQNNLPEPSAVHWHGMELPNDQDGVPGLTQSLIPPGGNYTYEFTAVSTGTHWYHSHMDGNQEGKGLFGSLEVVPRTGDIPADHDYRLMVGDGFLGFTFNGKSYPDTTPLKAKVGDRVHIRLIGTGPEMIHPIHLHGGNFQVIAQDGNPLPVPYSADTLLVGVGQTFDILFVPKQPGRWLLHCHIFSHSETSKGMAGIVTTLDVDPAPVIGGVPAPALPPVGDGGTAGTSGSGGAPSTTSAASKSGGRSAPSLPANPLPALPTLPSGRHA